MSAVTARADAAEDRAAAAADLARRLDRRVRAWWGSGSAGACRATSSSTASRSSVAYLLAWGVVRWVAPRADPVFLPIAGMLGGLGLAMIYRLLPAGVADEQALWLLIGLAAFVLTLLLVRDDRVLDGYTYTIGLLGLVLLLLPIVPGIGLDRERRADCGPTSGRSRSSRPSSGRS